MTVCHCNFWSTRDTIRNDLPSVTAIIETIVAIVAYWCLAVYFETYTFLLAGIVAAFLLLLRSDDSVALGVAWFKRWERTFRKNDWRSPDTLSQSDLKLQHMVSVISLAIAAISSFAVTFILAQQFLVGSKDWNALVAGFAIGWPAIGVGMAMASASSTATGVSKAAPALVAGGEVKTGDVAAGATVVQVMATIGTLGGALAAGVGVAGGVGIDVAALSQLLIGVIAATRTKLSAIFLLGASAVLVMTAAILVAAGVVAGLAGAVMAGVVVGLAGAMVTAPTIIGFALGILLVSLVIRIGATFCHLPAGFRAMPRNLRRLTICTSPRQPPELIPGLKEGDTRFTYQDMRSAARSQNDLLTRAFFLILLFGWFLPGWSYRFSLKSTAWFWGSLAYLGRAPAKMRDYDLELYVREVLDSDMGRLLYRLALASILVFVAVNGFYFRFSDKFNLVIGQPIPTIFVMFLLFGVSVVPWQLAGFLNSFTRVVIRFWVQHASIALRRADETDDALLQKTSRRKFVWIETSRRFATLCTILFLLGAAGHLALLSNSQSCWIKPPVTVQRWAEWIYGRWAPQPPSCAARSMKNLD